MPTIEDASRLALEKTTHLAHQYGPLSLYPTSVICIPVVLHVGGVHEADWVLYLLLLILASVALYLTARD